MLGITIFRIFGVSVCLVDPPSTLISVSVPAVHDTILEVFTPGAMSWVITVESKVTHSDAHVCLNTTFLVSLFNIELTSFGGIAISMWILELFDVLVTQALLREQ